MPFNEPYSLMSKSNGNKTHRLLHCFCLFPALCETMVHNRTGRHLQFFTLRVNALPSDRVGRLSASLLSPLSLAPLFSFFFWPESELQIKWLDPANIWRIQLHKGVRQRPGDSLTGPPPSADPQRCHEERSEGNKDASKKSKLPVDVYLWTRY